MNTLGGVPLILNVIYVEAILWRHVSPPTKFQKDFKSREKAKAVKKEKDRETQTVHKK